MRMQEIRSLSFSFLQSKKKSRHFAVAFDATAMIKTSQDQQSSIVEIPSKSAVRRRLILLRHAESFRENRSLRGICDFNLSFNFIIYIFL